jgi:Ner family transcriptional regulator
MHTNAHTAPPSDPAQLRAWIRYQLALRGTNLQKLAEKRELSRNAVRAALVRHYPLAERIIAAALDMKPEQIWPDRYDEFGLPLRGQIRPASGRSSKRNITPGARRAQGAGR